MPSRTIWQPGQSGNPGGRPREVAHVRILARSYTAEAVQTLADIMRHGRPDRARAAAAEALLNRAWGHPTVEVELAALTPAEVVVYALPDNGRGDAPITGTASL